MPMPQDLPSQKERSKLLFLQRGKKAVCFTKMSITCSYKVGFQNILYQNLTYFKLYNFVEGIGAENAFYRGDQGG